MGAPCKLTGAFSNARNATVNAGGGGIDTQANADTFSGVFSGSGALTKLGSGVLTLTGANTYAGPTTLSGGTVSVGADINLGAATGGLVFNGGTLQLTGAFSNARDVTLDAGGGIDTQANADTFSGVFSAAVRSPNWAAAC